MRLRDLCLPAAAAGLPHDSTNVRLQQLAKVPRLPGKPGRSVLQTWAVMRFLAPRTVRFVCLFTISLSVHN